MRKITENGKESDRKKLFVVSDIHGHCDQLVASLEASGFDKNNPEHIFVCCGDIFDRGEQNRQVLEYILSLPQRVLIRGNHDDMLEQLLMEGSVTDADVENGTDITVKEFLGEDAIGACGEIDVQKHAEQIAQLRKVISEMRDYFETENYIFTHGWLPLFDYEGEVIPNADWRRATFGEWCDARMTPWIDAYPKGATVEKTIVCGHMTVKLACMLDGTRTFFSTEPFYREGMIAIDALVYHSGVLNVLCLEDDILPAKKIQMSLIPSMYQKVSSGEKTVEIRLLDKKREAIRVGDIIEFENIKSRDEKIGAEVLGLYRYECFEDIVNSMLFEGTGLEYLLRSGALAVLEGIYGGKDSESGALAIRIRRI